MNRLRPLLVPLFMCGAVAAAEENTGAPAAPKENAGAPAAAEETSGQGMFDLLGGAAWKERRVEVSVGWNSVEVDGVKDEQSAVYLSGSAFAVSGYRKKDSVPIGGILGLGATVKTWIGQDNVDLWAIAPFALGVAGVFTDLNDRNRIEVIGKFGPGIGYVDIDGEGSTEFGWTWGIEGSLTITKGESRGLGVGIGYESIHLGDLDQDAFYLALRFAI